MKLRCKPGDLAYINYSAIPENIGTIVEVVELLLENMWKIKSRNPIKGYNVMTGELTTSHFAGIYDKFLTPITGVLPQDVVSYDKSKSYEEYENTLKEEANTGWTD